MASTANAAYAINQCGGSPAPTWINGYGNQPAWPSTVDDCQGSTRSFHFDLYPNAFMSGASWYQAGIAIPSKYPDLSISHINLQYTLAGDSSPDPAYLEFADSQALLGESQVGSGPQTSTFAVSPSQATDLSVQLYCSSGGGGGGCNFTSSTPLTIGPMTLTLNDSAPPQVAASGGSLLDGGSQAGIQTLGFTASDADSGVRLVTVALGDTQAGKQDYTFSRCSFTTWNPCPNTISDTVDVDTTQVPDGTYPVSITATDASGNPTTGQAGVIQVQNTPPSSSAGSAAPAPSPAAASLPTALPPTGGEPLAAANGTPASGQAHLLVRWAATRGALLSGAAYGQPHSLRGQLTTPTGQPIVGAAIVVRATPSYVGASAVREGQAETASDGTFAFETPPHQSGRSLTFIYDAHYGDAVPAATAQLAFSVAAPVALAVRPRVSAIGRRITFTGVLPGPIPAGGKQIVLQARQVVGRRGVGSWLTFQIARTNGAGRFVAHYRFKLPGPINYAFRVASFAEADYPFAAGFSRSVVVHER